ncbi:hypothetical protein A1D25_06885 [Ursidibacter arcticus]|uniref:TIR domain-containing protein n=1 Tax=Ursidibacter arcticus TaxID=1524965 RepID=UPI0012F9849B|nr:TIR domain-containing protein [Ursidibacter arcticus]KAE9534235.1 hypothetical protein A1D25_06885 [Ursidibacter arcticus]
MGLPRAFVGFSSTDLHYYRLMQAWKANTNIDFNFTDCQLRNEIKSEDEDYIKRKCRERINMAGTFISLIGQDTKSKYKYVRWEIEVALEKGCRIIAVNLDGSRQMNPNTCPAILKNTGTIFVPFSPKIIAYALENWEQKDSENWIYKDWVYQSLGY